MPDLSDHNQNCLCSECMSALGCACQLAAQVEANKILADINARAIARIAKLEGVLVLIRDGARGVTPPGSTFEQIGEWAARALKDS